MMIGTAIAPRPARRMGFRKDIRRESSKFQIPSSKFQRGLELGAWDFFGTWNLELGAFSFRARPCPERQITAQDLVHGLAGVGEDVMAIVFFGAGAEALAERADFAQVAFAGFARTGEDFWVLIGSWTPE